VYLAIFAVDALNLTANQAKTENHAKTAKMDQTQSHK